MSKNPGKSCFTVRKEWVKRQKSIAADNFNFEAYISNSINARGDSFPKSELHLVAEICGLNSKELVGDDNDTSRHLRMTGDDLHHFMEVISQDCGEMLVKARPRDFYCFHRFLRFTCVYETNVLFQVLKVSIKYAGQP